MALSLLVTLVLARGAMGQAEPGYLPTFPTLPILPDAGSPYPEVRTLPAEIGNQKSAVGNQKAEDSGQKTSVGDQKAEAENPKSENRPPASGIAVVNSEVDRPVYGRPPKEEDEETDFLIRTELPSPQRQFRRDSEEQVFERIRQEARRRPGAEKVPFPEEIPLTKDAYVHRSLSKERFPSTTKMVEPGYVFHGRLPFEQPNFERLGYSFGFLQPLVCLGVFYFDTLTSPYQYCKRPFQQFDTSAGKCLPGDPAPMVLEPVEPSLTGLLGQAGAATGIVLGFPGLFH